LQRRGRLQPPDDLVAFLGSGKPPLLVSLGAMSLGDDDARESAALFVEFISRPGCGPSSRVGCRDEAVGLPPDIFAAARAAA